MRVTGGSARGLNLRAPAGSATRPTTDRVREAIFSILGSMGADLARVLDLYAGSGAMAIDALSRGEGEATLVERAPAACAVIRANLQRVRFQARARLRCADVHRDLANLSPQTFTTIFLDPPYDDPRTVELLGRLGASGLLAEGGTIVLEHGRRHPPPEAIGAAELLSDRRYGDTGVAFYQ